MATAKVSSRRRGYRVLRLFYSLVLSFLLQYVRARLAGRRYDFFQDSEHNRRRAIKLRTTALELGGVLIKVGQFLSTRVDLLPVEYIEELSLLQDAVPAVPFAEIRPVIEAELGEPLDRLFASFEPVPIAAASLGQVHRATLPTGQQAAVKVQRPNIDQIVEADLSTLGVIVNTLDRFRAVRRRADLPLIMREFEATLRLELDYHAEAHHAERFAHIFQDSPNVAVPRIYWSHTRGRVISMQLFSGIKVTDFERLHEERINRSEVAEILMRAYLRQVLEIGFFHADPHPGNIFVQPGPVVVLMDFGMVGEISPRMRGSIRTVFLGVVRRDYDEVIDALARLGFFTRGADRRALKRALIWTVETFYDLSFGDLRSIHPGVVLDQLQEVLYAESFQIPANFAFLARALGTLSGLCTALDPSFQFVTVAEPYARSIIQRRPGVRGLVTEAAGEARELATTTYALPFLTRRLLEDAADVETSLRDQVATVVRAVERVERAVRRLFNAAIATGLVIAAAYLTGAHEHPLAIAALIVSLLFLFGVYLPGRRRR